MASILETFFIMFESNADKVKRGNEEARKETDKLEDSLNRSDRAAKKLGDHFLTTIKQVAGGIAAAFAVERIAEGITQQAEYNAQLGITAKRLDVNVSELDAWQRAAQRSGGTVEGFTGSLDFLNKNMAALAEGGQSRLKPFFEHLKINIQDAHTHAVRPLFDILGDLSDRFQHMNTQEVAGIGEKLGLDQGTVLMLQQGRRAIDDLVKREKELGVATQEDAERAHEFHQQMLDLETMLARVYTVIGSAVLPALTWVAEKTGEFVTFLENHKTIVEGFFIGIAAVIGAVYLPAIIEAAIATLAALAPFILIGLAIAAVGAAFALVYDDVVNFLHGNQSVIGELSKRWPRVGDLVKGVVKGIGTVIEWFSDAVMGAIELTVNGWQLFFAVVSAGFRLVSQGISVFVDFARAKIDALIRAFPGIGIAFKALGAVMELIGKGIVAVWDWILDKISKVGALLKGVAGFIGKATVAVNMVANPAAAHAVAGVGAARTALASAHVPIAAAGAVHKNLLVHVDNVNVQTQATDAEGVARGVGDALQTHLRHAVNQFDDGVRS